MPRPRWVRYGADLAGTLTREMGKTTMEKTLRQFAPFVALIVAAVLVVIANPGANTGNSSVSPPAVAAGASATRPVGTAAVAATVPTDATAAAAEAAPFGGSSVPAAGSTSPFSGSSSVPSSGFSSGSSTGSSFSSPSAPAPSFADGTTPAFTSTPSVSTPDVTLPATTPSFDSPATPAGTPAEVPVAGPVGSDFFLFDQVKASAVCSVGGNAAKPLELAGAYAQSVVAAEPAFPDRAAGITFNKTDAVDPDRYLYRTHGLIANSSLSITDLADNSSRILAQRADWERLEGVVWTQNRTLITGENVRVQQNPPPTTENSTAGVPKAGVAYEVNPVTGTSRPLPMLGSRAHKGMSFDHQGNLYSVSATVPGYAYRFVPAFAGATPNYTVGTLSALWIGPNGESTWLQLNSNTSGSFTNPLAVTDSDEAARLVGATALLSPEDAEMLIVTSSTGARRSQLFIAETGANRVLTVVLRTLTATTADNSAYVSTYVAPGINAPKEFAAPSDLALDTTFNLYIAERNGGGLDTSKTAGDDIWVAPANSQSAIQSLGVGRIASVTDCDASPTGLMFDLTGSKLFLDLKGRGGDGRDMTILITTAGGS